MKAKLSPEGFINFMEKNAREQIKLHGADSVYYYEKVEAWNEVLTWIKTYKEGKY
jgi:hypothetical protein